MEQTEKQAIKDFIGQYLDLARTRLKDIDLLFLQDLLKNWPKYAGQAYSHVNEGHGWGSDGKYTRVVKTTTTFLKDRVGVQVESTVLLDGVSQGTETTVLTKPRELLDLFKKRPHLLRD